MTINNFWQPSLAKNCLGQVSHIIPTRLDKNFEKATNRKVLEKKHNLKMIAVENSD